ncbi:MAG: DNA repair protein RadC [Candidatus Eiseniibacteriota bacterium]|nr:MAG: DNA repair protein RadC [Candidatus Eisenbacteria bacterium]
MLRAFFGVVRSVSGSKRKPQFVGDLPRVDRPREKLAQKGSSALSDAELLAVILGTGTRGIGVLQIAREILKSHGMSRLPSVSLSDLETTKGVGIARACQILACMELGRRVFCPENEFSALVKQPEDAAALSRELSVARKEHFCTLYLDTRNRLIKKEIISIGTLNASLVHPREVFQPAVECSAASVILVHNHPSGDAEPSREDLLLTKRLVAAGEIMGIDVLDHVIVARRSFVSLKERKLM